MKHHLRNPHGRVLCSCQDLPGDSCAYLARIYGPGGADIRTALYERLGASVGSDKTEVVDDETEDAR